MKEIRIEKEFEMQEKMSAEENQAVVETSDYKSWFNDLDVDLSADFDKVHSLYRSVQSNDPQYAEVELEVPDSSGTIRVSIPDRSDVKLMLTQEEKDEFLSYLDSLYDLTVDGEYMFRRAMEKDD